jgi:hypothetical protein
MPYTQMWEQQERERKILLKYEDFEAFLGRCISASVSVSHMTIFRKLNPEELKQDTLNTL